MDTVFDPAAPTGRPSQPPDPPVTQDWYDWDE